MPVPALVAAVVAAIVGAGVWGVITVATNSELGIIAWGIGIIVGLAGGRLSGGGPVVGIVCAALALGSIFGGKLFATELVLKNGFRNELDVSLERYETLMEKSEAFAKVDSKEGYPQFMLDHEYTEATSVGDVTEEEIEGFELFVEPTLRRLQDDEPSFETWRESWPDDAYAIFRSQVPLTRLVIEELNFIDVIFALLGLGTAFKLGMAGRPEMVVVPASQAADDETPQ